MGNGGSLWGLSLSFCTSGFCVSEIEMRFRESANPYRFSYFLQEISDYSRYPQNQEMAEIVFAVVASSFLAYIRTGCEPLVDSGI